MFLFYFNCENANRTLDRKRLSGKDGTSFKNLDAIMNIQCGMCVVIIVRFIGVLSNCLRFGKGLFVFLFDTRKVLEPKIRDAMMLLTVSKDKETVLFIIMLRMDIDDVIFLRANLIVTGSFLLV